MPAIGVVRFDSRQAQDGVSGIQARHDLLDACEQYLDAHRASWKNAKHRHQWQNTLATYVEPIIGGKDIASIDTEDMLAVLTPIWREKAETASRVRGRIEAILDWARARRLRSGANPATRRGRLAHLLPTRKKQREVRHHPVLPWREMPKFFAELRRHTGMSANALQFTILTAARTTDVLEAEWSEVNAELAVWTVPKERMKAVREHRIPFTEAALAVLAGTPKIEGGLYVFPGFRRGRPLSNMSMLELLRGMRPGLTVHRFRSTFRDWAAEATSFPRELAEAALAHIIGNAVERAYQRGDPI